MKSNKDILESYGTIADDEDDWFLLDGFGNVINHAYYSKVFSRRLSEDWLPVSCMLTDVDRIMIDMVDWIERERHADR